VYSVHACRYVLPLIISVLCVACSHTPSAPVIDRAPALKKPADPIPGAQSTSVSDWRPSTYVVKKGDTLYRIGLEFGFDYKEIAAANQLSPPYPIKVGQTLLLPSNVAVPSSSPPPEKEDGVVVTSIKTDTPPSIESKPVATTPPLLTQPKATREAYSLEAFQRKPGKPSETLVVAKKPAETAVKSPPNDTPQTKPNDSKNQDEASLNWTWPTNGKVISYFNEAANKGIDIGGTLGQPIHAASAGKVIYTGSDLRGYGKLVIIKHDKTYLSVYAHNSKILVKEGQMVTSGQKIAEMGDSDANGVKLHFEIRQQGKSVDPMKYLKN